MRVPDVDGVASDINVWSALVADRHAHHLIARHWFNNLPDESSYFGRVAQGFLPARDEPASCASRHC